ncbi:MAG: hypothetical protein M3178_09000 [Pseudomonadota bacterium]|nr:hypothetical protein [Pseudomonadota bacterium]
MVGLGIVSLDQAYRAIDFDTIALLLGMMIVVANLRLSGFFRLMSNWVVMRAHHPLMLLAAIVIVRPHAHHQDVRTGIRAELSAGHRAPRDQDRYVMIEIALSTATLRRPFFASVALFRASGDTPEKTGMPG